MMCYNYFGYGAHAYGIGTHEVVHAIFGWRLESGALYPHVDTVHESDAFLVSNVIGQGNEPMVVGFVHIGEARASREVRAIQWMLRKEVDMIIDDHEVANFKIGIHATGGIANEEGFNSQFIHYTFGESNFFHRVALVEVKTAFHGHDIFSPKLAKDKFTGMSFDSANGKVGNIFVGELVAIGYLGS